MGLRLAKKKKPTKSRETNKPTEEIKEDPRLIRDVGEWNRLRLLIYHELGHQAWGYPLYALFRKGKITQDMVDAGDAYWRAIQDFKSIHQLDPDPGDEFTHKRIKRVKSRHEDLMNELGIGRRIIDALIFDHEYPATERQLSITRACLQKLSIYFGSKRR